MAGGPQERWASQAEYLLSCLGYAVGIGNLWRFPYLCYRNGGGAFLIPYFLTLFICGIPLVYLETTLGQFASAGCISVFNISPLLKGAGYATIILNILAVMYFATIMSYPVLYMYHSLSVPLPWQNCGNEWNTEKCTEITAISSFFSSNGSMTTPEDEFFHIRLIQMSPSINQVGGIVWPVFWCNLICWIIVYLCICNGVKSVGKIVYFTVFFPYVVLAILFVRGVTLPGAWKGIQFYILPDWEQLKKPKVWADAATQLFYSLGPGWGGLLSMASFNRFHYKNFRSSVIISLMNSATSIWGGFVVFSVLGFAAERSGVPVGEVATAGPGLAFVTYPAVVTMMPAANFWAITFFIMLFFLGIDSMFVTIEAIIAGLVNEFKILRPRKRIITFLMCWALFLLSIICNTEGGLHIIGLLDAHVALVCVPTVCGLEILAALYIYGHKRFCSDVYFMVGKPIGKIWIILLRYIVPIILVTIIVYTLKDASGVAGWSIALVSVVCIPIYATILIFKSKGTLIQGGLHIIGLLDAHVALVCVPTVCGLEILAALYIYGHKRFCSDVYFMVGKPIGKIWIILLRYIVPIVLVTIIVYTLKDASGVAGWSIALVSVVCIPIYATILIFKSKGTLIQRIRNTCAPNCEWGPADPDDRLRWNEINKQQNIDIKLNELV